jgi:short-subunit dehydrogenase
MPSPKTKKQFHCFYSVEEWERICERSDKLHMKPATYIRKISVHGEIKHYDLSAAEKLTLAINRYGNNLNQIATVVNSSGSVYKNDVENLQNDMMNIKRAVQIYLTELKYELL